MMKMKDEGGDGGLAKSAEREKGVVDAKFTFLFGAR